MWGHTEIPLHPRLETIKYNSIYYLISLRQDLTRIFVMRIHSLTYCLSFLLLFVTMWILNIYPTLALLGVTFSIVQSLWSKITRLLRLSACCRCKTNITLTLGVEWLITDQQENIIFAFLQNLHIFVQINGRCANNRSFVIPSSRHPGCRQFHSSWSITWLRLHWRLCLGPPMSLFTLVFENFLHIFCKNSEIVPISEQKMSYIMLCY